MRLSVERVVGRVAYRVGAPARFFVISTSPASPPIQVSSVHEATPGFATSGRLARGSSPAIATGYRATFLRLGDR